MSCALQGGGRYVRCLIFTSHVPPKSPIIGGSFAENDLQLKASYGSSPFCNRLMRSLLYACIQYIQHTHYMRYNDECTYMHTLLNYHIIQMTHPISFAAIRCYKITRLHIYITYLMAAYVYIFIYTYDLMAA